MAAPLTQTLNPEQRSERARNAALARTDPEARARAIVRDWPALTAEQQARIRALVLPVIAPERAA